MSPNNYNLNLNNLIARNFMIERTTQDKLIIYVNGGLQNKNTIDLDILRLILYSITRKLRNNNNVNYRCFNRKSLLNKIKGLIDCGDFISGYL